MRAADRRPPPVILLEFDDVLAETRSLRIAALRTALAPDGVDVTDERYDTACAGLSFDAAVHALCRTMQSPLDPTAQSLASLRADREFATAAARGLRLAPGAREFVLGAGGVARLGIVTRAARRDVDLTLALSDLTDAFDVVMTRESHVGPEPSLEPFLTAHVRMAERAPIVVGDGIAMIASLNAAAAARAARFRTVVVGNVSPTVAFAGDGYLTTLENVTVHEVIHLAEGSRSL